MSIALKTMITDQQTYDARDAFGHVFQQLLIVKTLTSNHCEATRLHSKKLAGDLSRLTQSYKKQLYALPRYGTYSRHIIGTEDSWTGLICRWEQNITSSIHGHPAFAYYQVLEGCITMDFFEPINEIEARQVSTQKMCSGESIFSNAREGQLDNLVHQVRTKNTPVFTLHLYSGDPAKGRVFRAEKNTEEITPCSNT